MTVHQDAQNGPAKTLRRARSEGLARATRATDDALKDGAAMGEAAFTEGQAALKGMQAGSKEWAGWAQDAYQANVRAWQALLGCRTAQAAMSIQTNLMQEQLKLLMDNGRRMTMTGWKTALKENEHHV